MRDLDETDLEIVRLLQEDARRPYSEIADVVGLSPPAVSDRVSRLEELGVIRQFTIDVDRTAFRNRQPLVLRLEVTPAAVERVFEDLRDLEATEHVFQLLDGTILAHVAIPDEPVHVWLREHVDLEVLEGYEVTPLARYEWSVGVSPADFALSCVVCGNEVASDGAISQVGGETRAFCCETCKASFEAEYERLEQGVNED